MELEKAEAEQYCLVLSSPMLAIISGPLVMRDNKCTHHISHIQLDILYLVVKNILTEVAIKKDLSHYLTDSANDLVRRCYLESTEDTEPQNVEVK